MLDNISMIRELPLSHLIYKDHEIDAEKAKQLVVYHYALSKGYRWKEWQVCIDGELSHRHFPYLMRSYNGVFGLFVAVDNESDQPPKITNQDGEVLTPERIRYVPTLNPVWIRLMMRKLSAFGSHCQGAHSLGRPLLQTDIWHGEKSSGINAISLDCRTQQLNDKDTTEVVLFHENVPLRPLPQDEQPEKSDSALWIYDRNKILVRWYPSAKVGKGAVLYKETPKKANKRKTRAFLDLSSAKSLELSWPVILAPIQNEFIKYAEKFGFYLKPKVLSLQPLTVKTKYKSNKSKSVFPSIPASGKINVIDLRVSTTVSSRQIVDLLSELLHQKHFDIELELLSLITPENISECYFTDDQRVMVLLDQTPDIENDRYPLTEHLRTMCACQHININPHDLISDPIELNFLSEILVDKKTVLIPEPEYFNYVIDVDDSADDEKQKEHEKYLGELSRNLDIVIKELQLKHLLMCKDVKVSQVLPEQVDYLNSSLVYITDGYLFTVKNDRPVMIPFIPSESDYRTRCDAVLNEFGLSVESLLMDLESEWPYAYKMHDVMDKFGTDAEKYTRFLKRLTLVIRKKTDTRALMVLLQDPSYEKPHMLPLGLTDVMAELKKKSAKHALHDWLLPDEEKLNQQLDFLCSEEMIPDASVNQVRHSLSALCMCWMDTLKMLYQENVSVIDYKQIKKRMSKLWLQRDYVSAIGNGGAEIESIPEKAQKKRVNSRLISGWDHLLSLVFERPLTDPRTWLRNIPGIQKLWYDENQNYIVVGGLVSLQTKLQRQPSIRQWHPLRGTTDFEFLAGLLDVDWVRMNQLAGNPCVSVLVRRWHECNLFKNNILD